MTEDSIQCRLTVSHADFVLRNHRVHGVSVMPGVTFVDIISRILTARGADAARAIISDILFTEAVAAAEGLDREVTITIGAEVGGIRNITAASRRLRAGQPGGEWRENLTAKLTFAEPLPASRLDVVALKAAAHTIRDMAELYEQARQEHIAHGPPMRCLGRLYHGRDGLLAELELDPSAREHDDRFHVHPAKLDASTLIAFAQTPLLDAPFIPISLASVRVSRPLGGRCYVHVPRTEQIAPSGDVMHNDYRLYDGAGQLVAEFNRLTCKRIRFPGLITALIDEPAERLGQGAAASAVTPRPAARQDAATAADEPVARLTDYLRTMVGRALGVSPDQVSTSHGFYDQGLDSVAMLSISQELESVVASRLYPTLLFEFRNIDSLARHLAETYGGPAQPPPAHPALITSADPGRPSELDIFRRVWRPAPASDEPARRDLVLLTFAEGWGGAAAESLRAEGYRVALVSPAHEYAAADSPGRYYCDLSSTAQLGKVLNALAVAGHDLRTFAVLADAHMGRPGDAYAHDVFRALASALLEGRPSKPIRVCFVAAGGGGEVPPEYAAVGALARTVSAETPVLRCRSVAVEDVVEPDGLAALLARELADGGEEAEVRYRDGRREVARLESLALDEDKPDALRQRGAYLLAGGGGRLGRWLAGHLAERYKARLLLVGRSAPDINLIEQMTAWREGGAQAEYLRADITNLDDVRAAVGRAKELYGRLHGVFHLAGELHDAVFFRKDSTRTNRVIAPKLSGAVNLDFATRDEPLDAFVLFSSLSAVVANQGQSDYAYANAFLDYFAVRRQGRANRSGVTVAIGWPYWAEGGMRLDHAAVERARSTAGLEPLPTDVGLKALTAILGAGESHVAVAYGDAARFKPMLRVDTARPAPPPPGPARAHARTVEPASPPSHDIAIIGFAGRYPQAPDIPAFWQNLAAGRDAITEIPSERWEHGPFFDPSRGVHGKTYSRWGGFIDGVDRFAPAFFSISRRDAERMDPQERLFLQTAWHALEDAGYPPESLAGERVGVFAGVMWSHYQLVGGDQGVAPLALHSSVPNRVSYCFGLTGPSVAVDGAGT